MDVKALYTIDNVTAQIQDLESILVHKQMLVFCSEDEGEWAELKDGCNLADYQIKEGSLMQLLL